MSIELFNSFDVGLGIHLPPFLISLEGDVVNDLLGANQTIRFRDGIADFDQIETFLIRLSRGSGVQGLSAMSMTSSLDEKVKIFRPLLNQDKKKLVFTAKKVFGNYVKDPSNNNKKFLRSNIRKLLPVLKKYGINEDQIIKSINNLKSSRHCAPTFIPATTASLLPNSSRQATTCG